MKDRYIFLIAILLILGLVPAISLIRSFNRVYNPPPKSDLFEMIKKMEDSAPTKDRIKMIYNRMHLRYEYIEADTLENFYNQTYTDFENVYRDIRYKEPENADILKKTMDSLVVLERENYKEKHPDKQ